MEKAKVILVFLLIIANLNLLSASLDISFDDDTLPRVIIGDETTTTTPGGNITNINNYYNVTQGTSNIFDQDLNTTDDVEFNDVTITGWFRGLFNWTTLTSWLSFDGATLSFNESRLNDTIDARAGGLGDNASWNESYANDLYVNVNGDQMTGNLNLTNGANVTANDFIIPAMKGNNNYESLNDAFNLFNSAGRISGGEIVEYNSTAIIVTAGEGILRIADDDVSQVKFIGWDNSSPIVVPTDSIMYFGVEYNGGDVQVVTKSDYTLFDLDTDFPLGSTINQKGELYILNNPWWVGDGLTNVIERFQAEGWLERDENRGGLIIGVTGTRNPTMTGGTLWGRLTEHIIPAFDSSTGDTFDMYYRDGAGSYNEMSDLTQYNVTRWDDGTGTLKTIGNNQYAVIWVWINVASEKISLIYPQATYSNTASAEAEEVPNTFPEIWYKGGIIAGRIIIKQGQDAPVEVQSVFTQTFTAAQAADHGNLAGLGDDDHTQYLLTSGLRAMAGNLSMGGYQLTNVGKIVMSGLITSQSIIPVTDNLYTLGNSSNRFKSLYAVNIYSTNITTTNLQSNFINATNINSSFINSNSINSTNIDSNLIKSGIVNSTEVNSQNLTVGGAKVYVKDSTTYYRGVA